jgi:2-polyprenyl-3-methyl-5-hydroxy-6-metoxy-1,4-benzoquinol methylase
MRPAQGPGADGGVKFDRYAREYDDLHRASIAASGESTRYFAEYKLACLERLGVGARDAVLDYGCGIGNLLEVLEGQVQTLHGFDPSEESVATARQRAPSATLHTDVTKVPEQHFDVAVLSGVLHHIVPAERAAVMSRVASKLKPGGRVVVFEHNPFNPLTRRAVAACEFDDDAILLWPWSLKGLLRESGFQGVALEYIVFFPRPLAFLRPLEPRLSWLLLGAQQMAYATKP